MRHLLVTSHTQENSFELVILNLKTEIEAHWSGSSTLTGIGKGRVNEGQIKATRSCPAALELANAFSVRFLGWNLLEERN